MECRVWLRPLGFDDKASLGRLSMQWRCQEYGFKLVADGGWCIVQCIVTNCVKHRHTAGSVDAGLLAQRLWQADGSGVSQDDNASFVSEVSLKIQKLKKFHSLADETSWRLVFFSLMACRVWVGDALL